MNHADADVALGIASSLAAEHAIAPSRRLAEQQGGPAPVPDDSGQEPRAAPAPEVLTRLAGFAQLTPGNAPATGGTPLDFLLDVTVTMTAELGHKTLPLAEILKLGVGSVVELDRFVGEPVDLSVKGVILARGEVVVVEDRFALRVKEIMKPRLGPSEKRS
jgi:flagellar motor switch protein FliN/FliY